ncbi:FecR family protein [Chitinophaga sp. XS-30]|uniref:FecR family protein n=1 Tax=Chitinophaga sp. XS-30 TaxID=2604421 RepID=UPI0011DE2FA2|nr:FecR domain-containing protein [Chitinophaga sp. XS-30]QEH42954.1 FecR family protein [Chitinophaga sp. XS-30]
MKHPESYIRELLAKKNWTDEECRWLLHYLEHTPGTELKSYLLERFREQGVAVPEEEAHPRGQGAAVPDNGLQQTILENIHRHIQPEKTKIVPMHRRFRTIGVAAAVAAIIITTGVLIFPRSSSTTQQAIAYTPATEDIAPGGNRAQLVLGNGRALLLEQTADGPITAGSEQVNKEGDGLVYGSSSHTGINKLITPKGGQYKVQLADGTKVWLNAASSLQYPASFNGSDRTVELSGEAYFEVAKDAARPFFVKMNGMNVQVLGTHFNINAYPDEKRFTTTLLEGAVRVVAGGRQATLSPGEQSILENASGVLRHKPADTENAVAWKNGILTFRNDELAAVMRNISRWYDVDIRYDEGIDEKIHVTGAMRKQEYLSQALKILELTTELHFSLQGRTITVSK